MIRNRHPLIYLFFCSFVILLLIPRAYGKEIPDDIAIEIIISEAANQGLKGMICVAEVLRNRATIKGLHRSAEVGKQPKYIWKRAAKAWEESAHTNYTKGADHFANIHKGKPWWAKHCIQTYAYKDHVFYKEMTIIDQKYYVSQHK